MDTEKQTPENIRPKRYSSESGPEITLSSVNRRHVFRQIGWQGHSGLFYSLDEDPSLYEKGGFSPMWIQVHSGSYLNTDEELLDDELDAAPKEAPNFKIGPHGEVAYDDHRVPGRCPACGRPGLTIMSNNHITCAYLDCPNPTKLNDLIQEFRSGEILVWIPEKVQPTIIENDPKPRVSIRVIFTNGNIMYYPVPPLEGWKIDTTNRVLIIGKNVPRTHIPLDNVIHFDLERVNEP